MSHSLQDAVAESILRMARLFSTKLCFASFRPSGTFWFFLTILPKLNFTFKGRDNPA